MSLSQRLIRQQNPRPGGRRAALRPAAPVACESLEPRALLSATATGGTDGGTTAATDSTGLTAATTDTHTSSGKGQNGYPHGKFGFW